jgi:hypothetical protein
MTTGMIREWRCTDPSGPVRADRSQRENSHRQRPFATFRGECIPSKIRAQGDVSSTPWGRDVWPSTISAGPEGPGDTVIIVRVDRVK